MRTLTFDPMFFYPYRDRKFNFHNSCSCDNNYIKLKIDILEKEDAIYLLVEVPGIKKEDISININKDNILSIKGEKKSAEEFADPDLKYFLKERCYGEFNRQFVLPDNIDANNIKADYNNGELIIRLSKKPEAPSNDIKITIA